MKRHRSKSLDLPLVLLNLIAIFRIKIYEDFDTNFSFMGMSIDVFHFKGKTGLYRNLLCQMIIFNIDINK
jgi:hypothetical protein